MYGENELLFKNESKYVHVLFVFGRYFSFMIILDSLTFTLGVIEFSVH